jgi:cation transport ATPase
MRINPKIIQVAGDALIPLAGYFWWEWNMYFILLFYLLDYISSEIFLHVKSKKIQSSQKTPVEIWIKNAIISSFLLIFSVLCVHLAMLQISPGIQFTDELLRFWKYKDLGIEQGYVLIPLIFLVGFQRYKIEFVATAQFKKVHMKELWKQHIVVHFAILAFSSIVIGLSTFIVFPEIVYIATIILASSIFLLLRVNR